MKNDNKMSMLPLSIWLSFTEVLKICMNKNYLEVENLKISNELLKFVNNELLNDTGITPEKFWSGFNKSVHELAPKNKELIKELMLKIILQ